MSRAAAGYGLGIDTGGTFTDAVAVDPASGRVLAKAKQPTTHHDLSLGMSRAVGDVLASAGLDPARAELVAVSSTLATNSVVEGRGSRVGLFLIGHNKALDLPVVSTVHLRGGHTLDGEEVEPLDLDGLIQGVSEFTGRVEAYAVASAMSFVNPAHELVAAKAISLTDPRPVFCSHQASSQAGIRERAATAVLHARLMPIMGQFLSKVKDTLSNMGFACDMVVVRGDATTMSLDQAGQRAADTVGSGPAATAVFGGRAAPRPDAVLVDVGGTTTDIILLEAGRPCIDDEGSVIGEWQTHVRALEMLTVGVGGDSHVHGPLSGRMLLGPARAAPLALTRGLPDPGAWLGGEAAAMCVLASPAARGREDEDPILRRLLDNGPSTPEALARALRTSAFGLAGRIDDLCRRQLAVKAGFTPTDALHALGRLDFGDREAALRGARALAPAFDLKPEPLCLKVLSMAEDRIEEAILARTLRKETGLGLEGLVADRRRLSRLKVRFTLNAPLVGIGAAATQFLPGVAERLGAKVVFPEHHEVGNAVGAILLALESRS
ncbi:MAG: hydantoinase/oxoprolinase family protein [Desulfovibrionaceae bacterium]|nr:hydantoinase/oxoprolinase family protein [Desulfovibrionaceae bacterium]